MLRITAFKQRKPRGGLARPAFTIIEMMVAMAILTILMVIVFEIVNSTTKVWKSTSNKMNVFQGARAGFEAMTRNLGQATLQTYYDYANASGQPVTLYNPSFTGSTVNRNQVPAYYLRASELHFITDQAKDLFNRASITNDTATHTMFFQAPTGVGENPLLRANETMLNNYGYYIEFGPSISPNNISRTSSQINESYRYRLMEIVQPAERNTIYQSTVKANLNASYTYDVDWIRNMNLTGSNSVAHPIAENVIALIINPKLSAKDEIDYGDKLSTNFVYDSRSWESSYSGKGRSPSGNLANTNNINNTVRNQLPPLVEVIMVCIDESSAQRLNRENGTSPPFSSGTNNISTLFTKSTSLETDLEDLQKKLNKIPVNYRIFRTTVPIQAAKWSR